MITCHIAELGRNGSLSNGRTNGQGSGSDSYSGAHGECDNDGAITMILLCGYGSGKGVNACGSQDGVKAEFLEGGSQTDSSIKAGGVQFVNNQM